MMKNATLLICLLMIAVYALPSSTDSLMCYGLSRGCSSTNRLLYFLIHLNGLHLALNLYVVLTMSFLSGARCWQLFAGILIAVSVPPFVMTEIPIVGFSTVIYAIAGMMMVADAKWKWLVATNLMIVAIQSLLSGIAWLPHLYCFIAGLSVGLLFTPRFDE